MSTLRLPPWTGRDTLTRRDGWRMGGSKSVSPLIFLYRSFPSCVELRQQPGRRINPTRGYSLDPRWPRVPQRDRMLTRNAQYRLGACSFRLGLKSPIPPYRHSHSTIRRNCCGPGTSLDVCRASTASNSPDTPPSNAQMAPSTNCYFTTRGLLLWGRRVCIWQ